MASPVGQSLTYFMWLPSRVGISRILRRLSAKSRTSVEGAEAPNSPLCLTEQVLNPRNLLDSLDAAVGISEGPVAVNASS